MRRSESGRSVLAPPILAVPTTDASARLASRRFAPVGAASPAEWRSSPPVAVSDRTAGPDGGTSQAGRAGQDRADLPKPAEAATPAAPAAAAAPTSERPRPPKPAEAAKPAAAPSGKPVSPIAASGGLKETTLTIIIFSGPEADAHTRLAPKFTEYTKGKVKIQVEEGGRGDAYDAKWIPGMQAKTTAWDILHNNQHRFLASGPAGYFVPLSRP